MCILCVIQKWARRVATLLPWLVIPLIGLWALSQLLPAELRFEITSPRLACVLVLLVTLFWYEVLMPRLSAWRVRRNARLKERKRFEEIELQKLRKNATRRCRNCLTPYKDQNPGGGKFMCSYCGHISKRPVLDLSVPPGTVMSNSGIFNNLIGRSGKMLNGRVWSDNGLMCSQDWLENGNWVGGSIVGKSSYWWKNGSGLFHGDDNCSGGKLYSGVLTFISRLLTIFFLSISWLWKKIFRFGSSIEDASSNMLHRGMLSKRDDNGTNYQESRVEKARRKAEEKRLAKLERELLEEEERKQREEVARLVEERRRLRDEKMEAGKDESKSRLPATEKDGRKEAERKRHDRRKEKDKASSKSNSDAEELDKRSGKDSEQNRDFDRKKCTDHQEQQKTVIESVKMPNTEPGHGIKNMSASNFNKGNAGSRYFNRMRGTFLSSSIDFSRSGFFGKSSTTPVTVAKETEFNNSADHVHASAAYKRDAATPDRLVGRSNMNVEDKKFSSPVISESQLRATPKKSWHQLFTRSSSPNSSSNRSVISRPNSKPHVEVQNPNLSGQSSAMQSFNSPINFGLPSPFNLTTFANVSSTSNFGLSPPVEAIFPHAVHTPVSPDSTPEVPELFEDPCYVPDPLSLLGPVSESLDNFQLDLGTHVASDTGLERRPGSRDLSPPGGNRPSSFKSPLLQLQNGGEKYHSSGRFMTTPKAENFHTQPLENENVNEKGTWQMWNSSLGGPGGWLFPPEKNGIVKEEVLQPSSQKTMASLFAKDDKTHSVVHSPQKGFLGNGQTVRAVNDVSYSSDNDPWFQKAYFPPLSGSDNQFSTKSLEKNTQPEVIYQSQSCPSTDNPYEIPSANSWSKKEYPLKGSGEGVVKSSAAGPSVGGLVPNTDVQSLWTFG